MTEDPFEPAPGATAPRSPIEEHLKSRSTWLRLFFMIVVALLYTVARFVATVVVVVQFFHVLLTGEANVRLEELGHSLALYAYQVIEYLTFNSDVRPFPFDAEWPGQRNP